jgi:hypothetical protein
MSLNPQKALETIGNNLQRQYERWQPRARLVEDLSVTTTSRTSVPLLELRVLKTRNGTVTIVILYFRAIRRPFLQTHLSRPEIHMAVFTSSLLLSDYEFSFQFF